jgi:hypothetical protein
MLEARRWLDAQFWNPSAHHLSTCNYVINETFKPHEWSRGMEWNLNDDKNFIMMGLVPKYSYDLKLSEMKAHLVYLIVLYLLLKFQRIRFPKKFHNKTKSLFKHLNSKTTFLDYHFISNIELHKYVFRHK